MCAISAFTIASYHHQTSHRDTYVGKRVVVGVVSLELVIVEVVKGIICIYTIEMVDLTHHDVIVCQNQSLNKKDWTAFL